MRETVKFNYYLPVHLIFGRGEVNRIGEIAGAYGKKALIVTGQNSTKKSGLLDRVTDLLKNCLLYTSPSPRD